MAKFGDADDDASAFDLLVCCSSPLSRSQLLVEFSSIYDRQPHPDSRLEQTIEKTWEQCIAVQRSIFNATKFRYGGHQQVFVVDGVEGQQKVCLHLGLTDYKTFIGTNMSRGWKQFLASSADDWHRCRYTASPLGNGAIVETADHHILILQRSVDVGECPGYMVFPGGHSEPEVVGIKSHLDGGIADIKGLNNMIAQEMFDGIVREVVEETGVLASSLSDPVFIGISRRKLNVRPTAFFYMNCSLTLAEVLETYKHAEHASESSVLLSTLPDELLDAGKKMPGCHHGGAALYQLMREALSKGSPFSRREAT